MEYVRIALRCSLNAQRAHKYLFRALFEDSCLFLVPGSHALPRSVEQRSLSSTMEPPTNALDMPGAIRVTIKRKPRHIRPSLVFSLIIPSSAGETAFYNSNILHCASYSSANKRATLHGTMGSTRGGFSRARNILQHGLNWMTEPRFRDTLNKRGQMMLDNLVKMKDGAGSVGYSLDN